MHLAVDPAGHGRAVPARATAPEASAAEMLLARIAKGDIVAERVLFVRHRTPVYRWLLRFVSNESLAEDLLNEFFVDEWL